MPAAAVDVRFADVRDPGGHNSDSHQGGRDVSPQGVWDADGRNWAGQSSQDFIDDECRGGGAESDVNPNYVDTRPTSKATTTSLPPATTEPPNSSFVVQSPHCADLRGKTSNTTTHGGRRSVVRVNGEEVPPSQIDEGIDGDPPTVNDQGNYHATHIR